MENFSIYDPPYNESRSINKPITYNEDDFVLKNKGKSTSTVPPAIAKGTGNSSCSIVA
jgi:hypothetical protein